MRLPLALLILVALLSSSPLAAAQQQSALLLSTEPLTHALAPGESVHIEGRAEYFADPTVLLELTGVKVSYHVEKAPEWATVTISPTTDVFMPSTQGTYAAHASRAFTVRVDVAPGFEGRALAGITIRGITESASSSNAAMTEFPVLAQTRAACRGDSVSTQASNVRPIETTTAPALAFAGLAAVGLVAIPSRRTRAAGLAALALVGGLAFLGGAHAQQQSVLGLGFESADDLPAGDALGAVMGRLDYAADPTVSAQTLGVPVFYSVSKMPAWATVILMPSMDLLTPSGTGPTFQASKQLVALVHADENIPNDRLGTIEITAATNPGSGGNPAVTRATFAIRAIAAPECEKDEPVTVASIFTPLNASRSAVDPTADAAAPTEEKQEDRPVDLQSREAEPRRSVWLPILGLAVFGAIVGLVLRRRL